MLAIADDDFQVVREFWCDGMSHPAGLTVYNKILYVVEQFQQAVRILFYSLVLYSFVFDLSLCLSLAIDPMT